MSDPDAPIVEGPISGKLTAIPGAVTTTNDYGLDELRRRYFCLTADVPKLRPLRFSDDRATYRSATGKDGYTGLNLQTATVTDGEGLTSELECLYKGLIKPGNVPAPFMSQETDILSSQWGLGQEVAISVPVLTMRYVMATMPQAGVDYFPGQFTLQPYGFPEDTNNPNAVAFPDCANQNVPLYEYIVPTAPAIVAIKTLGYAVFIPNPFGWKLRKGLDWSQAGKYFEIDAVYRRDYLYYGNSPTPLSAEQTQILT